MTIVTIQYDVKFKDLNTNYLKVNELLEKEMTNNKLENEKEMIDLILVPEMALTGYVFENFDDIIDFCEIYSDSSDSISFKLGRNLALKYNCYVLIGYPEKLENKLFNSAALFDRSGLLIKNFRKHFLYETDKKWALEGESFNTAIIKNMNGEEIKIGVGICMDINPYEFKSNYKDKEFGNFCLKENVDLICFLANWLRSDKNEDSSLNTINYWYDRLDVLNTNKSNKNIYFVCSNRIGKEKNVEFVGSSCIVSIHPIPKLHKYINFDKEGIIKFNLYF